MENTNKLTNVLNTVLSKLDDKDKYDFINYTDKYLHDWVFFNNSTHIFEPHYKKYHNVVFSIAEDNDNNDKIILNINVNEAKYRLTHIFISDKAKTYCFESKLSEINFIIKKFIYDVFNKYKDDEIMQICKNYLLDNGINNIINDIYKNTGNIYELITEKMNKIISNY